MERTIVLVDDHSLFRNGLRGLLEHCAGCRVVGEAASGEEFLAMLGGKAEDDPENGESGGQLGLFS